MAVPLSKLSVAFLPSNAASSKGLTPLRSWRQNIRGRNISPLE
jgi:hypothetical protein